MTPTQARDRAAALAIRDTDGALAVARMASDPWYACQALAWVARFAPDDRLVAIVEESLKVGRVAIEPYQVVGSAAWPVRALVERGYRDRLDPLLQKLLGQAGQIEALVSRSEALFLVFQAVHPAGRRWWGSMFEGLHLASEPVVHWRQARNLRDAVLIVAGEDFEAAHTLCRLVKDGRTRSQIERRLADSQFGTPRPFFWP